MSLLRIICPASILFLLLMASSSLAFTCKVSATGLSFGSYDFFASAPTDTTGTINVSCNIPPQNPAAPFLVTISLSPGNSGSFGQRQMYPVAGGSDRLNYNIYSNPSFSTILGDGSGGSSVLTNSVTRDTPWNVTLYARIPPRQNARVGAYSDLITVTIDW